MALSYSTTYDHSVSMIDNREEANIDEQENQIWLPGEQPFEENEDYGADDELESADEFADVFDISVDAEQFQSFKALFPELCYEAKFAYTSPKRMSKRYSPATNSPIVLHQGKTFLVPQFQDDNSSDEEWLEEHECPPDCYLCRISASIYKAKHPELYGDGELTDEDDDFDDIVTSGPPTHCSPDCISCAREQLQAEGWKFPVYKHEESDDEETKKKEPGKDEQPLLEPTAVLQEQQFGSIFSPPSPSLQKVPTAQLLEPAVYFPRVFSPPPKVFKLY